VPSRAGSINFFSEKIPFKLRQKQQVRLWIEAVARKTKKHCGEINFIFCSDKYLLSLNRDYLKHDYFTDIITFSNATDKQTISGDVYISIDRIRENAKSFKCTVRDELHRVMIHGVLHLCGFTDKTKAERLIMRGMENKMLSLRTF
jgi:rRNA maturation RNase YbeY